MPAEKAQRQAHGTVECTRKQAQQAKVNVIVRHRTAQLYRKSAEHCNKQHKSSESAADEQKKQRTAQGRLLHAVGKQAQNAKRQQSPKCAAKLRSNCCKHCIRTAEGCSDKLARQALRSIRQKLCRSQKQVIQRCIEKKDFICINCHRRTSLLQDNYKPGK